MSIRIIPQDELGSSEKRTADMIPPLSPFSLMD